LLIVGEGQLSVQCLTRSSVETSKFDLANGLRSAFELMGCEVEFSGSYPVGHQILIRDFRCFVPIYEKQTVKNQK
jgi:dipeptidase D